MSGEVQLSILPVSGRFDSQHDHWLDQMTAFGVELRTATDGVSMVGEIRPGTKGVAESIVVSLASAGSLTAFVELTKSWLSRDRTRSLKVSWSGDGELESVELSGADLDDEAFDELTRAVTDRIAGRSE